MSTSFVDSDGTTRFHGDIPNTPALRYLEWTWDGAPTKSVTFPAGTVLTFGCVVVLEEFLTPGTAGFDLGTIADTTAFASNSSPSAVDVLLTNTDIGGGTSPSGLQYGLPYANDQFTVFPVATEIVGTLTPDTSTAGMLRFYFMGAVPTPA